MLPFLLIVSIEKKNHLILTVVSKKCTQDNLIRMKRIFFFVSLTLLLVIAYAQKPRNGTYTYKIAYAEWGGKTMGATCMVVIKGDSIKIIHNGRKGITGNKGDILDQGIIMKHTRTGKWIIGHRPADKNAKEIGGCSEGPAIIEFSKKLFWTC